MKKMSLTAVIGAVSIASLSFSNLCFAGQILLDEFDGSTVGTPHGVAYVVAKNGQGARFSPDLESRIQYSFGSQIPTQGTIEFQIFVESGYNYSSSTLNEGNDSALIFTTDIQGGDVTWPGSTWVYASQNGDIRFHIAGEKYESGWNAEYVLNAIGTTFRFNEWHTIGLSYGDQGRHIMVDGELVATNTVQTQHLGRGGTHSAPVDIPTIGESVPGFWQNNQWEGGFVGIVDRFRTSDSQSDWVLSAAAPSSMLLPDGNIKGNAKGDVLWTGVGNILDTYIGVNAYMNDLAMSGTYQCTELAKRFAKDALHIAKPIEKKGKLFASANDAKIGHIAINGVITDIKTKYYPSGSLVGPVNGAIISQKSPSAPIPGHVSIAKQVSVVDENTLDVVLFEQNWIWTNKKTNKSFMAHSRHLTFTKDANGEWTGSGTGKGNTVIGWLNPEPQQ